MGANSTYPFQNDSIILRLFDNRTGNDSIKKPKHVVAVSISLAILRVVTIMRLGVQFSVS